MVDKTSKISEGLNPEQKRAVESIDGPLLIVAGAGSGKTRVLTSRVAYILDTHDLDPARILALTFTKKAAGEMKERIAMMVGDRRARRVVMGTFHSIFIRFLRQYAGFLGYPENFTIYDTSDSTSAIKACIKELQLDDKVYKPRDVLSRISFVKNALYTPEAYMRNAEFAAADASSKRPQTGRLFSLYQQKLRQSGVMDFDDILLQTNILFRDNGEALEEIASRFSYIMVDEYQDTNYAQYLILKKLSKEHHNICVVGDDSQSIYAFRGAKIENILNFQKDYPEAKVIRLERNYRSTSIIVDAANSVIAHNEGRIPKKCYAVGEQGEKIGLLKAYTEQDEAVMIVSDILQRMRSAGARYQDFAILYRTNSQSRALEEQLRRRNIPYMIYSGNSFFERAEIKDMMAYFKLVVNVSDDESFRRVVNLPARGIGDTSVSALNECARAHQCPLFKAAFMPDCERFGLRAGAVQKIQQFCRMIDRLSSMVAVTDAYELACRIAEDSGLYASFKADTSIEGMARVANLDELVNSVKMFIEDRQQEFIDDGVEEKDFPIVALSDFLENIALLSNVDVADDEDTNNKVALMTVHSAKGLEFPYVFVAGCEENLFPSGGMLASRQEIEEERRLFYVAVTRAKKAVELSFATTRMRNGKHESNSPSRFVREIDEQYISNPLPEEVFLDDDDDEPDFGGFGSGFGASARRAGNFPSEARNYGRGPRSAGGYKSSGNFGTSGNSGNPSSVGYGNYRYGASSKVQYSKGDRSGAGIPETKKPGRGFLQGGAGAAAKPSPLVKPNATPALIDPDFVAVPMEQLREGERIEHNRFGAGKIVSISGVAPNLKAVVEFDDYGLKQLLLKYAKLRPEKK